MAGWSLDFVRGACFGGLFLGILWLYSQYLYIKVQILRFTFGKSKQNAHANERAAEADSSSSCTATCYTTYTVIIASDY